MAEPSAQTPQAPAASQVPAATTQALAPVPAPPAVSVPGVRKAAILALLLGEEPAGEMFKYLREEEIERIAREVATLGRVQPDVGSHVLQEFHLMWQAAESSAAGGVDYASKLLMKSVGPDAARKILDRVVNAVGSAAAFTALENRRSAAAVEVRAQRAPADDRADSRPPEADAGGAAAELLPEELRVDVLSRMAVLEEISPEVIGRISAVIEQRLKSLGGSTHESYGGVRAVAEVLNHMDRTASQPVLEAIEARRPTSRRRFATSCSCSTTCGRWKRRR